MPKIIELRQNRNHIRSNFDGYKLSLDPVPVIKQELFIAPYRAETNDEQYSFLHAELFSMQNLLQVDPWARTQSYYINCMGEIVRASYNENTGQSQPQQIVFRLSEFLQSHRQKGDYNYTMRFLSEKYCILCDGIQSLILFETGDRLKFVKWKIITNCFIPYNLKKEEQRHFLIFDSRLDMIKEQKQISIALGHVQRVEENNSSIHYMYIHWCILRLTEDIWDYSILDTLEGRGSIHYCAFEPKAESLVICSNRGLKWRSECRENCLSSEPERPQLHNDSTNSDDITSFSWYQTEDDITVKFKVKHNKGKNDYTVKCKNENIIVKCNEDILLDYELYEKIDYDLTTWTIENNFLQITLIKQNSNLRWPSLLANMAGPKEDPEQASNATISLEQKPIANLEAPIEECDFPVYSSEDEVTIYRFHLPTHSITHTVILGSTPPLFTTSLRPGFPLAFATRQDVDACLWLQKHQPHKPDEWSLHHEGNLHAFGYIQASKQQKKFIDCAPDLSYALICESHRHIFLYRSNYDTANGLRNRNGPQISIGKQHLITLEELGEVLGLSTANNVTIILTEKFLLYVQIP